MGTGPTSANVRFSQFADGGNPLPTTLNFPEQPSPVTAVSASSIDRGVSPNSSLVVDSTGVDNMPVQTGSARIAAAGNVDGFAIFCYAPAGQEAAVPLRANCCRRVGPTLIGRGHLTIVPWALQARPRTFFQADSALTLLPRARRSRANIITFCPSHRTSASFFRWIADSSSKKRRPNRLAERAPPAFRPRLPTQ
jgi:hypothetical protein